MSDNLIKHQCAGKNQELHIYFLPNKNSVCVCGGGVEITNNCGVWLLLLLLFSYTASFELVSILLYIFFFLDFFLEIWGE